VNHTDILAAFWMLNMFVFVHIYVYYKYVNFVSKLEHEKQIY